MHVEPGSSPDRHGSRQIDEITLEAVLAERSSAAVWQYRAGIYGQVHGA